MEHGTYPLKIQVPAPSINKLLNSCPCDKENPISPPRTDSCSDPVQACRAVITSDMPCLG